MPKIAWIKTPPVFEKCDGGVAVTYASGTKQVTVAMGRNTLRKALKRGTRLLDQIERDDQGKVSGIKG